MNVLFLSPHYPPEMPSFVRGLAAVGAKVIGVGDQPLGNLPASVQENMAAYIDVPSLFDEQALIKRVAQVVRRTPIHRIETLWEPLVLTAANMRAALGVPGMTAEVVNGFRDKSVMKARLQAAGVRVPKFAEVGTVEAARDALLDIGFPCIVKPVSGAGSQDTYRLETMDEFEAIVPAIAHLPTVSIEEFIDGEEFSYDTLCVDGKPVFENVTQYHPTPLIRRRNQWISPAQMTFADPYRAELQQGIEMGREVLAALNMGSGFTHMEWFRKASGEVVFGEIGCRPGGGRLVDQINFANDVDLFTEWARVVCFGRFEAQPHRRYHTAIIYKRAIGEGWIQHVEGLQALRDYCGPGLVMEDLLPLGSRRRNWEQTLIGDGFVIVRHHDYAECVEMMRRAVVDLKIYAGH